AFEQAVCAPEGEEQLADRETGRGAAENERIVQPARADARILARAGAAEARGEGGKPRRANLRRNHLGRPCRKRGRGELRMIFKSDIFGLTEIQSHKGLGHHSGTSYPRY